MLKLACVTRPPTFEVLQLIAPWLRPPISANNNNTTTQQQEDEDTYDAVVDNWVSARTATLQQQVAGLRLLHACLDCWMFQYPLTEEGLVEKLGLWAMAGLATSSASQQQQGQGQGQQGQQQQGQQQSYAAVIGDPEPAGLTAFLEEAKATYALGRNKKVEHVGPCRSSIMANLSSTHDRPSRCCHLWCAKGGMSMYACSFACSSSRSRTTLSHRTLNEPTITHCTTAPLCYMFPAFVVLHSTGLLGIALANEEYADEAVQTQLIPAACRYLQRAVMTPHQLTAAQQATLAQSMQQQTQQHQPQGSTTWDRHKAPAKSALKAAGASGGAAAAGGGGAGGVGSGGGDGADQQQPNNASSSSQPGRQQQGLGSSQGDPPSLDQQPSQQSQQQQVLSLPGNGYLPLVAISPDGLVPGDEVLQLRLRKLLGVMRVLTCTGTCVCVCIGVCWCCAG